MMLREHSNVMKNWNTADQCDESKCAADADAAACSKQSWRQNSSWMLERLQNASRLPNDVQRQCNAFRFDSNQSNVTVKQALKQSRAEQSGAEKSDVHLTAIGAHT